jgi:hypothetical protein
MAVALGLEAMGVSLYVAEGLKSRPRKLLGAVLVGLVV